MRTKIWRQDLAFYRFTTELQTRYADMDTERHINNVVVLGLHGEARSRLHLSLLGADWLRHTGLVRTAGFSNDF